MKLIIGLGNPGDEYAATRHNIGRRLVEFIAAEENVRFASKKSQKAAIASVTWGEDAVHLAHPLTYMNLSGESVAALVKYWKVAVTKDLLIVVDDIALPFGKFRLRGEGSSGGHNGLASIEQHLGTRDYARLRIGIDAPEQRPCGSSLRDEAPLRDYVLSAFTKVEERRMKALLVTGVEACRAWALEPLAKAMSHVNASEF